MTKVLLVEDDNNLREIYEARLAAEGYDIATAKDGEDALAVAKQETPDLIISDVMMPRISGFEMLDILRNTEGLKHTKVIMLTALGQAEDKSRADNLGADRYLVKSQVTLEDIVKAAEELLSPASAEAAPTAVETPTDTQSVVPAAAVAATPAPEPVVADPAPVSEQPEPAVAPAPSEPDAPTPTEPAIVSEPAATLSNTPEPPVTSAPSDDTATPSSDSTTPTPPEPAQPAVVAEPNPVAAPQPAVDPVAVGTPPIDDLPVTPITTTTETAEAPEPAVAADPAPVSEQPEPAVAPAPSEPDTDDAVIQMPQPAVDPEVAAVAASIQSTLEESSNVEEQVKNFENAETAAAPVATPAAAEPSIAVEEPVEAEATPQPTPITVEQPAENPDPSPQPSVAQIPGKLVIQPPTDHANEPDISALVAQEEYQEQTDAGVTGAPVVSVAPDQPAETPTSENPTPEPGGVFMPNNGGNANDTAL